MGGMPPIQPTSQPSYQAPQNSQPTSSGKLSVSQFGATIKAKYPQYASYSDEDIGQKTLDKYPQYQDKVEVYQAPQPIQEEHGTGLAGFGGKLVSSLLKLPARAATNIINAGQIIAGKPETQPFSSKFLGEIKPIGDTGRGFGADVMDSIGSGVEGASYLVGGGGVGAVAKAGTKGLIKNAVVQGAKAGLGGGALAGLGTSMQQGDSLGQTAINTGLGGVAGGLTGGLLGAGGGLLGATKNTLLKQPNGLGQLAPDSAGIMQRVARISKSKQEKFKQTAGESVGEFLTSRNIFGTPEQIAEKLTTTFQKSKNTADEALEILEGRFSPEPVGTALRDLKAYLIDVSSPGAVDPQLAKTTELLNKYENGGLDMTEINAVKRLYERNVKLDFLRSVNTKGITRANNIDNAVRTWQFAKARELGLKNLDAINRETRLSKQLADDIGKEYAGQEGNNAITLTDWVLLSGGEPSNVAGFLAKKTFGSKRVQSSVAKLFNDKSKIKAPIKAEFGGKSGVPAKIPGRDYGTIIELPGRKAKFQDEAPAKQVFNQNRIDNQLKLPEGKKGSSQGTPIYLPSKGILQGQQKLREAAIRTKQPLLQLPQKEVKKPLLNNTSKQEVNATINKIEKQPTLQDKLEMAEVQYQIAKDAFDADRAGELSKYASKSGDFKGQLKEVTGGTNNSKFGRKGDELASNAGFGDISNQRIKTAVAHPENIKYRKNKPE